MTTNLSQIRQKDIDYTLHPYTNISTHERNGPLVITRGDGINVWDDQGNKYIEGLAGLWCVSLGFSEPRLGRAAAKQFDTLPYTHTFAHRSSEPVIELSERLISMAPEKMTKAFFVNSGSEAVDTAIKFAWYYNNGLGRSEKKKIISRRRGYHGVTVAGGSLTAIPLMQNGFDLPIARMLQTDTPNYYRFSDENESEEQFSDRLAKNLEDLILSEGPETVAAFIAEPIMGAGGVILPPKTYFKKIQDVLNKYDVLMIADEVICGFGRTGNMWGSQTYKIQPDMVTCAKQLSSGYLPIAALMISKDIYDVFRNQSDKHGVLGMGYTYGGHPVAAAVAVETLKIYHEREIIKHVQSIAPKFQERLSELDNLPLIGEARGIGLIAGLELVSNKTTRASYPSEIKASALVAEHALKHGLIVRGLPGDVIGICPPLIIQENEIDDLFDRLTVALNDAHDTIEKSS